jgi:hypothetical protein
LALLFSCFSLIVEAQTHSATFPGGSSELAKFLDENLEFPKSAASFQGDTLVKVVIRIDAFGKASFAFSLSNGDDLGFVESVKKTIQMMPLWNPAMVDGKPESAQIMIEAYFQRKLGSANHLKKHDKYQDYYLTYDVAPAFPGGKYMLQQTLIGFMKDSLKISGAQCYVSFKMIVDVDGSLSSIQVLDITGNVSSEQWIKSLYATGNWQAAQINGKTVKSQYLFQLTLSYR